MAQRAIEEFVEEEGLHQADVVNVTTCVRFRQLFRPPLLSFVSTTWQHFQVFVWACVQTCLMIVLDLFNDLNFLCGLVNTHI